MQLFGIDLKSLIITLPIIIISLSFHEFMHAYVAYKMGDPTAKLMGRMTLNPIVHMDSIGMLVMIVTGCFGWAKPVPVNPAYFKDSSKGMLGVSLAGPISNLVLAILFGICVKITSFFITTPESLERLLIIYNIFSYGVIINLTLCLFNLIPLAPLDGSKVLLSCISDYRIKTSIMRFYEQYSSIVLLFLLITGVVNKLFDPLISLLYNLIV